MARHGARPPSSEPENNLGAGKSWASTPKPGAPFPRNGHLRVTCGHPARPEAQAHCKLRQAVQIPGSWAVCTDANSQRVSGRSGHSSPEDTGVWGGAGSMAPTQLTCFQEVCWSARAQTSGTQETAVLPSIPDSQHGSPVWVSLCPPSPAQAHPRIRTSSHHPSSPAAMPK